MPDVLVLGVDPGATTGYALVDSAGCALLTGTVDLQKLSTLDRMDRLREFVTDHRFAEVDFVVLEDVSKSHSYITGGQTRTASSIASVQRDFASLAYGFRELWDDRFLLAPVAKWFPRMDGRLMKHTVAVEWIRRLAASKDPSAKLRNEHITMAYGIAMWGSQRIDLLGRLIK